MAQLATFVIPEDPLFEERDDFNVSFPPVVPVNFDTVAPEELRTSPGLSDAFKEIVCRCMAVNENNRPTLQALLTICETQAGLIDDWVGLADEVSDMFDSLEVDDLDVEDLDYGRR
jgi:hypothetical protein